MAKLITVPTFTFYQSDLLYQEINAEKPIHVDYYNGTIVLRQEGQFTAQNEILISPDHMNFLFKEIKKHLKEATEILNMKNKNGS